MKKILLLLLAVFLIGIFVSTVAADDDGVSADSSNVNADVNSDASFAEHMQNLVNGKETPITSKDINNTPGLSGKLVMGQCALINMSKEDLNKAKETVKKPTDEQQQPTKSRSFIDWLGEHPEIGQDIDNQVQTMQNPDSNKWMSQATKILIKELESEGEGGHGFITFIKLMHAGIRDMAHDVGHFISMSGWNPKVPQKDPRAL